MAGSTGLSVPMLHTSPRGANPGGATGRQIVTIASCSSAGGRQTSLKSRQGSVAGMCCRSEAALGEAGLSISALPCSLARGWV